jgi:Ankyrin repeats (3 copies)
MLKLLMRAALVAATLLYIPLLAAAPYKKGIKLNTFFRVSSASPVAFLEKHGITIPDLISAADFKVERNKDLAPLLNSLKPADFPYAFFYTNEFMFTRRFPGIFAVKVDSAAWMALIKVGAENNPNGRDRIRNRFHKVPREDLVMEILPDGILMLPSEEAEAMPEIKSLQELHDAITNDMGIKPDTTAFVEYHEKSGFVDVAERIRALLAGRSPSMQSPAVEKILLRLVKNPFLNAILSTKQSSLRISLADGFTMVADYTLGATSHRDAFKKSLWSLQVLGSIGTTLGIAAWEAGMRGIPAKGANQKIAMDLIQKFSDSFEQIRVTDREDKVNLAWQFVNNKDLIPAMQLAKGMLEKKKAEQRNNERIEAVRDEVCAALLRKDKEKFRAKVIAYAGMLPAEEHKIWRIRQSCSDGSGILLSALEFGGEDTFLKVVKRLKYHVGYGPMVNSKGKGYLHIAVERRHQQALQQILDDGILTNSADAAGKTPLIYAIESKSIATVKLLLDRGVRVLGEDDLTLEKKTLTAAEASGNEKILQLIRAAIEGEKLLRKKHETQS